jgi:23S rRNA (adenine2503-C2)-methyltransferase
VAAPSERSTYDVSRAELDELLAGWGLPGYRSNQVWQGLHQQLARFEELTALPAALRARLAEALPPALERVVERTADDGETVKWLWRLHDGATVETVLMRYRDRDTVCVSSQAGCAMACGFCATGQAGFERHLTSGEIVEQVVVAARRARELRGSPDRSVNVVFMGMGEPMANYDATLAAVTRMHDDMGIGARHLTISTVGIIPGIRRLADEPLPVNLAVSLHAATDELRDDLVPINKRYPLDDLMAACGRYLQAKGRRLSIEWALIDGVNDTFEQADALARRAQGLPLAAHVNLIPLNPTPGYPVRGTPMGRVRAFRDRLAERGVNATIRRTRGVEIEAACGQLRADHEARPIAVTPRPRPASGQRTRTVRPSA